MTEKITLAPIVAASVIAGSVAIATPPAAAQEAGWDGEAEVGASFFFGNTTQSLVNARLSAGHADSTWEIAGDGSFRYGRAEREEGEGTRLTHRSWSLEAAADYLPFATIGWFALGGLESSFQRRIDLRTDAGAGVKYTFVRREGARLDVSAALLAERTAFEEDPDALEPTEDEWVGRWSYRVRGKRVVGDDRVVLESVTFYRPEADFDAYVIETENSAAYRLTDTFSLKVSLVDTYDSEAEERGAESNNDGQVLVSVLGSF
ncbi:MAG: DUF481 domain-containing protein [Gemmatimonadota bacterium]|nr:DUF481 domain-containing protein [Gemmatimonadota bacterium]